MDVNRSKVTKEFIKKLPFREHIEKFNVEIKLLDYEIDQLTERYNIVSGQLQEPERVENSASNYNSRHNSNGHIDPTKSDSEITNESNSHRGCEKKLDQFKDESIYMLERRISEGQELYAMVKSREPWVRCKVLQIIRKFTHGNLCRPVFKFKLRTITGEDPRIIFVDKFSIALIQNHGDKLKPTKRVIAGFKDSELMPGIIGFGPSEQNKNRYLVHMDDGSACYFKPEQLYPIFGQSAIPWKDARRLLGLTSEAIEYEAFLTYFFRSFPKRVISAAKVNDELTVKRQGELVVCKVVEKDCDVFKVSYGEGEGAEKELIFSGSARFSNRIRTIIQQLKFQNPLAHFNCGYLMFFMNMYTKASELALNEDMIQRKSDYQKARKSTATRTPPPISVNLDGIPVFENRSDIKDWNADDLNLHECGSYCLTIEGIKTETSVENLTDQYRTISDLKVPLCLGWKRDFYRFPPSKKNQSYSIQVVYQSPCGKSFKELKGIRSYISKTKSKFDIDYFSFERELVLNRVHGEVKAYHYVDNIAKDQNKKPLENKHICLINQFNEERLAFDFEYRSQTHPHSVLSQRGFSFNKEFKSGCDCESNCHPRSACHCQILNEEAADSNGCLKGSLNKKCQYMFKRLPQQCVTGIFECNEFCKCDSKCPNRVVQNGIRFRLQVRKTLKKGWGVISLDDIPPGAFICTYSAELLDDADQYGDSDMYYADLDFISVNEQKKDGYDSEKDEGVDSASSDEDTPPETNSKKSRKENGTHESPIASHSRYPRRKVKEDNVAHRNELIERAKKIPFVKIHEVLESHDYTLDARVQGNVGRFFNHSCDPNTFVQNVFIDTHDLRFPVVAFFAHRLIKAHDEITWNYNYSMGAIAGRRIDCHCEAANCRGRIL